MLGLGLKEKLFVRIVKNTGELAIVSSERFPRVFLHIGLKFTYNREDFLVEICILLSLVILGTYVRGEKVRNK